MKDALRGALAEAEAAMIDVDAGANKEQLAIPANLVKSRLIFASQVLGNDDSGAHSLEELIASVKEKKTKVPCKLWESLITIGHAQELAVASFDRLAADENCCKEQIAEALKACATQRDTLQDLTKSVTQATKDLKTAKSNREKIKAEPKKTAGGRAPDPAAGASTNSTAKNLRAANHAKPIFEFCTSYGAEVRCFRSEAELLVAASAAGDLDCSKPWVLCGAATLLERVSSERDVNAAISAFKSSWATSAIRANPGRGLQRLKDQSTAAVARAIMAGYLNRHVLPVPASASELATSLASSIFAVSVGNEAAYVEKDSLPTLRMATVGSRLVCLCQLDVASKALEIDMAKPNAFARLSQAFLAATQAKVNTIGSDLHHFTLGPGDVLYTPGGYVVAEAAGIGNGPRSSGKDARGLGRDLLMRHALGLNYCILLAFEGLGAESAGRV